MLPITLYWLKRDFRLLDNPALTAALSSGRQVCALYIIEPEMLQAGETSAFHLSAISQALIGLRKSLEKRGGHVLVIEGGVVQCLDRLHRLHPISRLVAHEEIGNDRTYRRDLEVHGWCRAHGIAFDEYRQTGVFRRLKNRDERNALWTNFYSTPALSIPEGIDRLIIPEMYEPMALTADEVNDLLCGEHALTELQSTHVQKIDERAAYECLESFLHHRGRYYRRAMSSPLTAPEQCSRLSAHLAWGTITGRSVYQSLMLRLQELTAAKAAGDATAGGWAMSLRSFASRLHWRDHFIQRLESEPEMEFRALNPAYRELEYDDPPEHLLAWITGTTGYPMVDAVIRSLHVTGYTNFRMRAMITSFACHVLAIDWRKINEPMARMYTDYEPGIHLAQLQMQAGVVGINSLRVYSPTKQIVDQDPNCVFIKKWVPELAPFSAEQIIAHRDQPLGEYPAQIIDWKVGSKVMKDRIFAIRKLEGSKQAAKDTYVKHGSRKRPYTSRSRGMSTAKTSKSKEKKVAKSPKQKKGAKASLGIGTGRLFD